MFKNFSNISSNKVGTIKNSFIIVFVIFLVFSRFIIDLFVVLGALSFIYFKIKKNIKINLNILLYFIVFYIYLIISSFNSEVPLVSFSSAIPYIRFILFVFFIRIYFCDYSCLKTLLYSFFFIYSLLLIDVIFQILIGHNLLGYTNDPSGRISSFFGSRLILGSFISKTFVIIIFLIFYLNIKHKYLTYFSTVIISFFLVYVSRERAAFFVFFGSLFISFFLIKKKYFLKITSVILSCIFFLFFFYQEPFQRIYHHTKFQLFEESNRFTFFSERHQLHFLTAIRIFKKHPFFGGGVNSFRYLCDKEPYSVKDLILADQKNKTFSKEDGYYYNIKSYTVPLNEKDTFTLIYIISKEYFENNNMRNYDEKAFLQFSDKFSGNNKIYTSYLINNDHLFNKINYENFGYVKKGSLLFISYEFKNGCNTHPHHIFIQFLSEVGIFGLIFLLIFYFYICKSLLIRIFLFIKKGIITNDIVLYGYFFTFFLPVIPSGNFFNNYYSILLYLPFTFILLCQRK
jgi:O-antigen ligase